MTTMPTEKEHVKTVGLGPFTAAYGRALFVACSDPRLTGLEKIRHAIAHEAALRASGYPDRPFVMPRRCGHARQEMQDIAEATLIQAIKAAREVFPDG